MSLPEHVLISPISISAMLENIINYTDLVETAQFLIEKYKEFYVYKEEVLDELGKRRVDIEIDVKGIKDKDMLKFVFDNADVLMRPYTVKLHRRGSTRIRKTMVIQKTPLENKKIIENNYKRKRFLCFMC